MPDELSSGRNGSSHSPVVSSTARQEKIRARAVRVLGKVRRGESLSKAARNERIKPFTVKKYLPRQFRQDAPGKRWTPTKYDRLTIPMNVLTPQGPVTVPVRGSRERNLLGRYNVALRKWRENKPGADKELAKFAGQTVGGLPLITDMTVLARLEDADALRFEELYASLVRTA